MTGAEGRIMDTPEKTTSAETSSVFNRPASPIMVIILCGVLVIWIVCLKLTNPYHIHGIDAALKGNLHELRYAIEQFHDDTGRFPLVLQELVAKDAQHLLVPVQEGNKYQGPYLTPIGGVNNTGIPLNPLVLPGDWQKPFAKIITNHWRYDAKTGEVHSAIKGKTLDGRDYQSL